MSQPAHPNIVGANGLQQPKSNQKFGITFYDAALDEWETTAEKYEMIRLASICGGTATYGGIL